MNNTKVDNSQKTKKQHLVPQFYLRYFTSTPNAKKGCERIWVYDKQQDKSRELLIKDVAQKHCFYDIPVNLVQHAKCTDPIRNIDPQIVEHTFSEYEGIWTEYFNRLIIDVEHGCGFNITFKPMFACYMVRQFLRTFVLRDTNKEMLEGFYKALYEKQLSLKFLKIKFSIKVSIPDEWMRFNHINILFDQDIIHHLQKRLTKHIWLIGINNTSQMLYTSDNPVVMRGHLPLTSTQSLYFRTPGIEIVLPITPWYAIVVLDRSFFKKQLMKLGIRDGGRFILDDDRVIAYNKLQVESSRLQIFCAKSEFDLAKQLCDAQLELRDPNRKRAQIIPELPDNIIGVMRK